MKALILLTLITSCLTSCSDLDKNRLANEINIHNSQKEITRIIPIGDSSFYEKRLKLNSEKSFGLQSLENGYKDFQVRIWETFKEHKGKLILVEKHNNTWSSDAFEFQFVKTSSNYILDSIQGKRLIIGSPKSGWDKFSNKLVEMGILDLADFSAVPNYIVDSDENSVKIEIGMNNYYRVYEYLGPERRQNQFTQAKSIVNIIRYVHEQFSL